MLLHPNVYNMHYRSYAGGIVATADFRCPTREGSKTTAVNPCTLKFDQLRRSKGQLITGLPLPAKFHFVKDESGDENS
jgi:hypothetical protein